MKESGALTQVTMLCMDHAWSSLQSCGQEARHVSQIPCTYIKMSAAETLSTLTALPAAVSCTARLPVSGLSSARASSGCSSPADAHDLTYALLCPCQLKLRQPCQCKNWWDCVHPHYRHIPKRAPPAAMLATRASASSRASGWACVPRAAYSCCREGEITPPHLAAASRTPAASLLRGCRSICRKIEPQADSVAKGETWSVLCPW